MDQMNDVQLERDQLSTRLEQLQKVVQDVDGGTVTGNTDVLFID